MKLDILAFAAHPDDIELAAAGTLIKHQKAGKKIGIIDLTQGELGTRGTPITRKEEANESSKVLKLSARENLGMKDGFFSITEENLLKVITAIRKYQPEIILCNSPDRHPDHGVGGKLVSKACFLAGLKKIKTSNIQEWRPKMVLHYIQDNYIHPNIVVDITKEFETKQKAIACFKTQFFNPNSKEPATPISSEDFHYFIEARARDFGRIIKKKYGEGFTYERAIGVNDLTKLI